MIYNNIFILNLNKGGNIRMNARKNNTQALSTNFSRNRRDQGRIYYRDVNLQQLMVRTFIKFVICCCIFLLVLVIKSINTKPTNYIISKIDYGLNQRFEISKNINKVRNGFSYLAMQGEKALSVFKASDNSEIELILPMEGSITTFFGEIIQETNKTSRGIIIEGLVGEDVLAAQEGVVIETGYNPSSGNYIIIKHNGEMLSVYKKIAESKVEKNKRVLMGERIGISSGVLKFEIWKENTAVDPLAYINLEVQSQ